MYWTTRDLSHLQFAPHDLFRALQIWKLHSKCYPRHQVSPRQVHLLTPSSLDTAVCNSHALAHSRQASYQWLEHVFSGSLVPPAVPPRNTPALLSPPSSAVRSLGTHTTDAISFTKWIPFAIRWYFILVPTLLSTISATLVMILRWHSETHGGIGSESSAIFGWRFVPTLFAVVYTQLVAMILGAVKKTEPFARLARPIERVPVARYTLLENSKPWWTTLVHGFQKRRNRSSWNWSTIFCCITFMLTTLGISPLSAALLSTRNMQRSSSVELSRLVLNDTIPLSLRRERSTYLRTTGALLQNYSTSPWVTDEFFVLPFWPKEYSDS
jgi:hypothetical protein